MLMLKIYKNYPQYKYGPFLTLLTWYKSNILAKNIYNYKNNKENANKLYTI
ncbi:hypothetical protein UT300007_31880 [Clostridium sp. CTA-7]